MLSIWREVKYYNCTNQGPGPNQVARRRTGPDFQIIECNYFVGSKANQYLSGDGIDPDQWVGTCKYDTVVENCQTEGCFSIFDRSGDISIV